MKLIKKTVSIFLTLTIIFCIFSVVFFCAEAAITQTAQNYVTDMMKETFVVKSSNPSFNNQTVVYCIPKILLNSSDSSRINEEIREKYSSYFETLRASVEYYNSNDAYSNSYPGFLNEAISYEANIYKNILSVCIEHKYENNGYKDYSVYNIDVNSGKELSTSDVASRMKKSNNKINLVVKNQINEYFDSFNSEYLNEQSKQTLEQKRSNSLCEENLALNKLYIDESNKLIVIYKLFSMAGAELYYYKLDVSTIVCDAINYNLDIEWGKDNFSFENKISDLPLIQLDNGDYNYNMDYSLFNHLDFLPSDILAMKNNLQPCGGVCFGMSVMAFKNATNQLDIDFIENGKNTLYQLSKPNNNGAEKLRNAIGLYQASCASSNFKNSATAFDNFSTQTKLSILYHKMINIESTRRPVMLDYAWISDEKKHNNNVDSGVSAHAVLAYGIENEYAPYKINGKEYEYKIWIINPNKSFASNTSIDEANRYCMYLDANLSEFYMPISGTTADSENDYPLKSTPDGKMSNLGDANLQFITDDYDLLPPTTSYNGQNAFITVYKQAAVINGHLISGYNGDDNSIIGRSFTPCGQEASMNLTIDKNAFPEVKTVSDNQTIGYTSDNTSVFITANKDTILKIDDDNINLNNSDGSYQIELAKNNSEFDDILIKGNGNKNEINIMVSSQSLVINGEELSGISIESSDDTLTLDTDENTIIINEENNKFEKFEIIERGTTGDCNWTLDDNGVLTISGNGAMDDYSPSNKPWGQNIETVIFQNGVTYIGNHSFSSCYQLSNVIFSSTVTSIGACAFASCTNLKTLNLPQNLTTIGWAAFSNCESLSNLIIPASIGNDFGMDTGIWYNCYSLEEVKFLGFIRGIPQDTFANCNKLKTIEIPKSISYIGDGAFANCNSLDVVDYKGTVKHWENVSIGTENECLKKASINYCDYNTISLDEQKTINFPYKGGIEYFTIKPNKSISITFYSIGSDYYNGDCIVGYLYDESFNLLASNNEKGLSENFILSYTLEANKRYYFAAKFRDFFSTGDFDIKLKTDIISIENCLVVISPTSFVYDGLAKTPTVTVKDGSKTLTKDTDYTVSYSNNTNVGTATVTVTGKGNYTGTTTKLFTIAASDDNAKIGDVNGDDSVDVLDATMIQKFAVDRTTLANEQKELADVNNDGVVDILDATEIQKYAVDKIAEFKKKA